MIQKICDNCRKLLPTGSSCNCQDRYQKQSCKDYDKKIGYNQINRFYSSRQWQRIREEIIQIYCGLDIYSYFVLHKIEHGRTVHHIVELKDDWEKRLTKENLIYLTEQNHQVIHQRMKQEKEAVIRQLNNLVQQWKRLVKGE